MPWLPVSRLGPEALDPQLSQLWLLGQGLQWGQVREEAEAEAEAEAQARSAGFPSLSWLKQDTKDSLICALCQFWKDCHGSKKNK